MTYDFLIDCEDGTSLSATHFVATNQPLVVVSSAIGTKRSYYAPFANYLVEQGFQVVTFDHRGMGGSIEENDHCISLTNWGEQDLSAVIKWANEKDGGNQVLLVGHSIAGQIFPMATNKNLVSAAYFVASQTASQYYWTGPRKLSMLLFWNLMLPATTSLTGKLPSWAYGGKYSLHPDIAKEWASWGKHPNGSLQDCPKREQSFEEVQIPLRFLSFSDDKMLAPKSAVKKLSDQYGSVRKEHQHWYPDEFGMKSIGHFGFFRKGNEELWKDTCLWLQRYV